ncbi:MAG: cytochrome P460 family protein [Betaproteobacteria bacterium]|nr:cytochrome P460 family protein [Betaproteobacteria bacterium]
MKPATCAVIIIALTLTPGAPQARSASTPPAPASIALPANYQQWRHVKTQIIQEGPGFERFGGMHHIYANERAVSGLRSRRFERGATLVAEFRELDRKGNVIDGGAIRLVDVMLFDAERFAATDGWGYAEFIGPTLLAKTLDSRLECHACHTKRADKGHVFSELPR